MTHNKYLLVHGMDAIRQQWYHTEKRCLGTAFITEGDQRMRSGDPTVPSLLFPARVSDVVICAFS